MGAPVSRKTQTAQVETHSVRMCRGSVYLYECKLSCGAHPMRGTEMMSRYNGERAN